VHKKSRLTENFRLAGNQYMHKFPEETKVKKTLRLAALFGLAIACSTVAWAGNEKLLRITAGTTGR
jgi:hypothetical protein